MLANAYETGDSVVARDVGQDLAMAAKYRHSACVLHDGTSCFHLAEAYLAGKGVQQDKNEAIRYFRLSCEDVANLSNTMMGFACWKLGAALLEQDLLGNYDEALRDLDRACSMQATTCGAKHAYEGTGLAPSGPRPHGAVDYAFAMTRKEVTAICSRQGGKMRTVGSSPECIAPSLPAIGTTALYVAFQFCQRDSLCGITIALAVQPQEALARYASLQQQLHSLYGDPSQITLKTTRECREVSALTSCIHDGRDQFSTIWSWSDGSLSVGLAASEATTGILVDYLDSAGLQQAHDHGL